jgi:hypothetical protein
MEKSSENIEDLFVVNGRQFKMQIGLTLDCTRIIRSGLDGGISNTRLKMICIRDDKFKFRCLRYLQIAVDVNEQIRCHRITIILV